MKNKINLLIVLSTFFTSLVMAEDNSCNLAQYDFLTNQTTIQPIIKFINIIGAMPGAQAIFAKVREDQIKKWYEIKPNIERIANQKNNERNADAYLILACSKWMFENKTNEAINMLQSFDEKYPNSTTIFTVKISPIEICCIRLNSDYYNYFWNIISGKKKKKIYNTDKFKETGILHLIKYPMLASTVAKALLYRINNNTNLLKNIFNDKCYNRMRVDKINDKKMIFNTYNITLNDPICGNSHFERNEVIIARYLAYVDKKDGFSILKKVANVVSDDGFYWWINEQLGDMLLNNKQLSEAEKQYKLALKGYCNVISNETLYRKMVHSKSTRIENKLNTSNWERKLLELKKKVNKAGGNIKVNTDEFEVLQKIYQYKVENPKSDEFSKDYFIETLGRILKKEKQFSEPENIRKEINEFTDAFTNRVKKVNKDNKKDLLEQGRFIAVCLTQLAGNESDTETKETALAGIRKIINVEKPNENITINESTKNKVNGYIAQIIGIGKVDNPVPYPGSNFSDMDSPALLYAAEFALGKELSIENKRKIICALANSENPILFDFFNDLLLESEDSQIKRFAGRGLERIIRKRAKDINENGKIILKK